MTTAQPQAALSEQEVEHYLRQHPDFLQKHPELLVVLAPPARALGDTVTDFQQFQLKNLQQNAAAMKSRYDVLVDFCRDNLSVQTQVHDAVLRLIRARSLEQLLEAVTLDLVALFDVDVVRLALESELKQPQAVEWGEQGHSGIVLVELGTVAAALPGNRRAALVPDVQEMGFPGFDEVFSDCSEMIRSCAVLKLELPQVSRPALLAFGVRHESRFHPGQGVELLSFLAQIVGDRLDHYLIDLVL